MTIVTFFYSLTLNLREFFLYIFISNIRIFNTKLLCYLHNKTTCILVDFRRYIYVFVYIYIRYKHMFFLRCKIITICIWVTIFYGSCKGFRLRLKDEITQLSKNFNSLQIYKERMNDRERAQKKKIKCYSRYLIESLEGYTCPISILKMSTCINQNKPRNQLKCKFFIII